MSAELPQDVLAAANEACSLIDGYGLDRAEVIAAGLLAEREAATARERERAAKEVETFGERSDSRSIVMACIDIAAAIRSPDKDRGEEDNGEG